MGGLAPGLRQQFYRTATVRGKDVALFSDQIHVPLQPFAGTIGLAPALYLFMLFMNRPYAGVLLEHPSLIWMTLISEALGGLWMLSGA